MGAGRVRPLEHSFAVAEGTAPQVVAHFPEGGINETVVDGFSLDGAAPRTRAFHSYTSDAWVLESRPMCAGEPVRSNTPNVLFSIHILNSPRAQQILNRRSTEP